MWCTFPPMIRGWFTGIRLWLGRDGIRTPESGLAGPTSHLESGSESVGGVVLDGDGGIGDSIGITIMPCLTTADTIPTAQRFTTGTVTFAVEWGARKLSTARGQWPGLLTGIGRRPADTPRRAVRAASAPAPSAATTMADRPEAFPHAEAPASAGAAEGFTVVAAAGDGDSSGMSLLDREISKS
jgi:hypothetical protein